MSERTATTSFTLNEEMLEEFDQKCSELGMDRSSVIRGLINEFNSNFPSLKARGFFFGIGRPFAGEHLDEKEFEARIESIENELENLKSQVGVSKVDQ